jgi:Fe-S oxidoreductase
MFDPSSHDFYDPSAVEREVRRVAGVCHSCRRCEHLCPSFDVLFRALDRPEVDGDAGRLAGADLQRFSDLCYECRLCSARCPYTPPHRWDVDVPRLVLRDRAARVKHAGGPALRERILASADAVGRLSAAAAPLVNSLAESRLARTLLEKTLGVHRDRLLPTFAGETFVAWWARRGGATKPSERAPRRDRVALFVSCSLNFSAPDVARAAVAVLEKNGCELVVPEQRCCGMPFLEIGDVDAARECRLANVGAFHPFVEAGYAVVSAEPTCSLALKKEYPVLDTDARGAALSEATLDLCEFLMRRHAEGRLALDFARNPGRVLYQAPCHLKVQDIGLPSRDLLALISGAEVVTVEACTGHGGTWSTRKEYFPISTEIGRPVFDRVKEERPDAVATDCSRAGIQIKQGTGRTAKHPVQILAEAYGLSSQ